MTNIATPLSRSSRRHGPCSRVEHFLPPPRWRTTPRCATRPNAGLKPVPYGLQPVNDNPVTREKIELGKMLFFDPRLSASGVISCNTCHNLGTGGDDNLPTSVGHGWQKGPRNSPTVLNAVFNDAQFWDGRAEDLKAQAKGPGAGRRRDGQQAGEGRRHAEQHAGVR
jgi:hypothetical protein